MGQSYNMCNTNCIHASQLIEIAIAIKVIDLMWNL